MAFSIARSWVIVPLLFFLPLSSAECHKGDDACASEALSLLQVSSAMTRSQFEEGLSALELMKRHWNKDVEENTEASEAKKVEETEKARAAKKAADDDEAKRAEAEEHLEVYDSKVDGLGKVYYSRAFFDKCLGQWKDQCRESMEHDKENLKNMCESHLDRGYLKARLLVPRERIRDHFDHSMEVRGRNVTIYQGLRLPKYTEEGYMKTSVPVELQQRLVNWFRANRHSARPEEVVTTGQWCNNGYDNDDFYLAYGQNNGQHLVTELLEKHIKPQLTEWAQVQLDENPVVYGARMYHAGSMCSMHVDAEEDHIISAIYHLYDKDVKEDWPLSVLDHGGHEKHILSKPGDVIFYESASLPHGRKTAFQGEEYANIFFHFKPKGWDKARAAAHLNMLPYTGSDMLLQVPGPKPHPTTFHTSAECLPYGTSNSFAAAFNTTLMHLPFTHLGASVEPYDPL